MFEKLIEKLLGRIQTVYAHCDIPCGIYDPHRAQVAALTVIRMIDLMEDFIKLHGASEPEFHHVITRYTAVKEEHAEICKQEIRIIWGDYFKGEHLKKYPELNDLTHKIMQLGSKAKQTTERKTAVELLQAINRFAEIFWESKSIPTKKVKAPYKPEEEIVYPILS